MRPAFPRTAAPVSSKIVGVYQLLALRPLTLVSVPFFFDYSMRVIFINPQTICYLFYPSLRTHVFWRRAGWRHSQQQQQIKSLGDGEGNCWTTLISVTTHLWCPEQIYLSQSVPRSNNIYVLIYEYNIYAYEIVVSYIKIFYKSWNLMIHSRMTIVRL